MAGVYEVLIEERIFGKPPVPLKITYYRTKCWSLLDQTDNTKTELYNENTFKYNQVHAIKLKNLPSDFLGCGAISMKASEPMNGLNKVDI